MRERKGKSGCSVAGAGRLLTAYAGRKWHLPSGVQVPKYPTDPPPCGILAEHSILRRRHHVCHPVLEWVGVELWYEM